MKNPFSRIQEKLKNIIAKIKTPDVKAKIFSRSGYALLGGAAVSFVVLAAGPASIAVAAGATTLGLMGVGFGLVQEGDNVKHQAWMKEHPEALMIPIRKKKTRSVVENKTEAPAPAEQKAEAPAAVEKKPETAAPVAEAVPAPAVIEKKAEVTPVQPAAEFAVVAEKKPEAPAPAAAPAAEPAAKPEAPKP